MRYTQKALLAVLGMIVFGVSFLAGHSPQVETARAALPADGESDLGAEASATLPSDIRSRLVQAAPGAGTQDFRPAVTFWEVLGKVKTRYVDKITDQDHLTRGAVNSMLRALRDPYSRVISPEELALDQRQSAGEFSGVGVILGARLSGPQTPVRYRLSVTSPQPGPPRRPVESTDRSWQLVVVDVVPGSPAAQAGLQTGDVISRVDGQRIERPPLAGKTIDDLNLILNGNETHGVTLTVARGPQNQPVEARMDHGALSKIAPVETRILPHGMAYARIRLFNATTSEELESGLAKLSQSHPKSMMLDLRDNPGGSLAAAQAVIGILAPGGIAGLEDSRDKTEKLAAAAPTPYSFAHIVVLTNAGTAQTAELVAGTLRERKGARLAGAPTFGNGLVQSVFPLSDGWAYSLTTGRVRTEGGTDFNQRGLAVDQPLSPIILQGDGAIAAAEPILVAMK